MISEDPVPTENMYGKDLPCIPYPHHMLFILLLIINYVSKKDQDHKSYLLKTTQTGPVLTNQIMIGCQGQPKTPT